MTGITFKRFLAALSVATLISAGLAGCGDAAPTATPISEARPTSTEAPDADPTSEPTQSSEVRWQTFTSEEGGFMVDMPSEPAESSESADSALGNITFHFLQVADGDAQYAVSYNDYPVSLDDPEQVLKDAIEGAAQGEEVENTTSIEVQGHRGIAGEVTLQKIYHIWYRGVLVDKRLFQLILYAPEDNHADYDDEAERFARSFVLLNP